MVVNYQAFPIMDFRKGRVDSKQPWLISEDAFESISNGFIGKGVLQKRLGYSQFGEMSHSVLNEAVADTTNPVQGTLSNFPVRNSVFAAIFTDSTGTPQVMRYDGAGGFTGDGTGTLDVATGVYSLTWDAGPTGPITVDYVFLPGNAIMGIANHKSSAGGSTLLVFDTRRVGKWVVANSLFTDIVGADRFSGTSSQHFHWANWAGVLYFTNNNDVLDSYDGSSLSKPSVDIGAGAIAFTCLLVFAYKDHLVCFRSTEGGTLHAQRARWATAGGIDFTNDGFVDAPTSEFIKGGGFLGDDLIIFFDRSTWIFKHTQDVSLPFRWERIDNFSGSFSTHSVLSYSEEITAVASSKIISTDGLSVKTKNIDIPDIVQEFDQEVFDLIYAVFVEELDLQFTSYPDFGTTNTNDRMIVYNRINKTWSTNSIGFHVFGKWVVDNDLTWDTFGEATWDETEQIWDANTSGAQFPLVIAGSISGVIYKLNDTSADNGSSFEFSVKTKRFNPYIKKGFKARLGWVDFLVDKDPAVTLDVALFINQDTVAYQTDTLIFDGDDDKVWKRVYSGAIGEFHQIQLSKNALGQTPKIHAIVPYFLPVKGKFGV
jgi:hypothetical protein